MEIGALLRDVLRRAWVVALLVALAGGGAWAATSGSKNIYSAQMSLTVPSSRAQTISQTAQYVADFVAAIKMPDVTDYVAKKTGVSVDDVKKGSSAQQQESSSFIIVTYESTDRDTVGPVATELALRAAAITAQSTIQEAKAQVDSAKKTRDEAKVASDKADQAYQAAQATFNGLPPGVAYQQTLSDVNGIQKAIDKARIQGESTTALLSQLATAKAQLLTQSRASQEFEKLKTVRDAADVKLNEATGALAEAQSVYDRAILAPSVRGPSRDMTSAKVARVRAVMIASGIAAIIGFALLVLLAGLTAGRGRRVQAYADAATSAPPDSLLGGFMGPTASAPAGPATPLYSPGTVVPNGEFGAHDDLLAFPPTSPTQATRRRDVR